MTEMNSRRMMLGSMVAVAGSGSAAFLLQTRGITAAQAPSLDGGSSDAVLGEVRRQMKDALRGVHDGSAEALRRGASLARVWAAQIQTRTTDRDLQALAAAAVRQEGRTAILETPINHKEMESQLRAFGLTDIEIAQLDLHAPPDPQARASALDRLLAGGITPVVDRAVSLLTSTAERIEARGGLRPIAAFVGYCDDLCLVGDLFKMEMEVACALAALGALFPPMLAFAEVCGLFASFWLTLLAACQLCRLLFG